MKQFATLAIVLNRTNFAEADRVLTVLTVDRGKIRLLAKGVRKLKSRLAGGIELLSVNHITYIEGRGSLQTLISSRPEQTFKYITKDIDRTMLAYEFLKVINKVTEDEVDSDYFELLQNCLASLNNIDVDIIVIKLWFYARLLNLSGHNPNLQSDASGQKLQADKQYTFLFDDMTFSVQPNGTCSSNHIKLLRLAFTFDSPEKLAHVYASQELIDSLLVMTKNMARLYLHIK